MGTAENSGNQHTEQPKTLDKDDPEDEDGGSSNSSSDDEWTQKSTKNGRRRDGRKEKEEDKHEEEKPGRSQVIQYPEDHDHYEDISLGIIGMMKVVIGQTKFSRNYEEDLDVIIDTFDTYSNMCSLAPEQRRKVIPIMLKGHFLSLFNQRSVDSQPYDE